ncbi:MAG: NAD-dependent epimerase/dehydratase family protein [Candidatus Ancaeobacter aquaticus]|nr:NAD-dependent epimerase/dehydratase family protein [Candidatus Ancaeobacter aquaticus]
MKTLITGATGLVGSNLVERLSKDSNNTMRVIVRKDSDQSFLKTLPNIEFYYGDIRDASSLADAFKDIDVVFHCAALVSDWASREEMYDVNVNGLKNMMDGALKANIQRFVYVSSMVVLGMDPQDHLDELAPYVHTGDNYNYTKIEAEKLALKYCMDKNLKIVIIRPPYIYGPRDRQLFPRVLKYLENGKYTYIDGGNNPLNLVYVGNLVDALIKAATVENAPANIYHITDGEDITRRELIETMCDVLGYKKPQKSMSLKFARIVSDILEFVSKACKSKTAPILNKFRIKFMSTPLTFNITKAREQLGYNPRSTRECIKETLESLKDSK